MMKDISFIIPVYNTPIDKLKKCIESILGLQKKFDIEIVVVDDGSKEFVKTFFQEEFVDDVRYIYKKNGGVSSARNVGISVAEGKYISFVDADDLILEDAFDGIDISNEYQFIIFDIDVVENCKKSTWKVVNCNPGMIEKKDVIKELVISNRMNSPCSKLFLNSCVNQNNIRFDENIVTGEDMNFVIDYTQCATNIYYTGKSAYCYQREETSRIKRIKEFPDVYLSNLSFLRNKLEKMIKIYNLDSTYIDMLNIDHVEGIYNYVSDLMILNLCTCKVRKNILDEIQSLNIECSNASRKKRIKYELLSHEKWVLIYMIARLRKIYLQLK